MRRQKLKIIRNLRRVRDQSLVEENEGRLKHLLMTIPDVTEVDIESGGWSKTRVHVVLWGGWNVTCYQRWTEDALKDAILQTYRLIWQKKLKVNK